MGLFLSKPPHNTNKNKFYFSQKLPNFISPMKTPRTRAVLYWYCCHTWSQITAMCLRECYCGITTPTTGASCSRWQWTQKPTNGHGAENKGLTSWPWASLQKREQKDYKIQRPGMTAAKQCSWTSTGAAQMNWAWLRLNEQDQARQHPSLENTGNPTCSWGIMATGGCWERDSLSSGVGPLRFQEMPLGTTRSTKTE